MSSVGHKGVAGTLAKALDKLWWKRIRRDVKDFASVASCADEQRFNHTWLRLFTLYQFHPNRGTQLVDYLTNLHVSNGFDSVLIVVDHLTRMPLFGRSQRAQREKKLLVCFYRESIGYTDCIECPLVIATRNSSVAFGRRFGDA
jgi:hypothetical protein